LFFIIDSFILVYSKIKKKESEELKMKIESYILGANGLEKLEERENLPINSRVYSFGAGMSDAEWAVIDDNNNLVKISENYEGSYFSSPYHKFDKYDRPLSKKFGIGFYYDDINSEFRFTDKEVNEAIERADLFIEEQKEKSRIEAEKNQKEIDNLPSLYPHLTPLTTDRHDKKVIKNNLIADLKKNFPDIKFSVRCEHHSTYNVSWINGVTTDKVSKICSKFEDHVNDWSGDYRDYSPSNFNKVFGGFKYVFENRKYCDKINALYSKDYNKDHEYNSQLNKVLWKTDIPKEFETVEFVDNELIFTLPEKTNNKPDLIDDNKAAIKTNNTDISIIDYSEKAIAVIGNTKPIKDQLKALGGRFNFRLTCGVGWIFAKTKREEVEKLISVLV
jgi:hypothetical protein